MNIDITKIKYGSIPIEFDYIFNEEQLKNTEIMELKINASGSISNNLEGYYLTISVKGQMYLPCSVSLKKTEYPFKFNIEEEINCYNSQSQNKNTL